VGEEPFGATLPVHAELVLIGGDDVAARMDGEPIAAGPIARGAGAHQLTLTTRGGALVWAGWIALAEGTVVRVRVPLAPACTRVDLARASLVAEAVRAEGVRCDRWVAVAPSPAARRGAIRIATCEAGRCGPLVEWGTAAAIAKSGPERAERADRRGWPAWGTWALVGVGVAAVTVTAIIASGALDARPTETRFVNGGVKAE
jgi:hypothetical protein